MLARNTSEIIAAANAAIVLYEKNCNEIPAGKNGIARKERLKTLLIQIALASPTEAFIQLYVFLSTDAKLSRLLNYLEIKLLEIANIPTKPFTNLFHFTPQHLNPEEQLATFVKKLGYEPQQHYGIN